MKVQLTELENTVVVYSLNRLEPWIGSEGYSDLDTKEISEDTKIPMNKLRGVLSSLEQKEVMYSYEHDANDDWDRKPKWVKLWLFADQEETDIESIKLKCQIA
tara:strand:- start:2814 stop:3122 length:309 start_codon:yes stop_codon:yes gene_type:complete